MFLFAGNGTTFITVSRVNYGTGQVAVTGNTVRGNGTGTGPHDTAQEEPSAFRPGRTSIKAQGASLSAISAKTGIPKTSLHRYLVGNTSATVQT